MLKTSDGATLGIEWSIDDGVGKPPTADEHSEDRKPILLLASGLQNCSDCTQTREIWWHAKKLGYKVGSILLRNNVNIPCTSGKFNSSTAWPDMKVAIELVYEKYVLDKKKQKKVTTFYAYGVS